MGKTTVEKALEVLQHQLQKKQGGKQEENSVSSSTSSVSESSSKSGGGSTTSLIKKKKSDKKKSKKSGGTTIRVSRRTKRNKSKSSKKASTTSTSDTPVTSSGVLLYGGATVGVLMDRIQTLESDLKQTQTQMGNMFSFVQKLSGGGALKKTKKNGGAGPCNDIASGAKKWNKLTDCTADCVGTKPVCRRKCAKKVDCRLNNGGKKAGSSKATPFQKSGGASKFKTSTLTVQDGKIKYKLPKLLL